MIEHTYIAFCPKYVEIVDENKSELTLKLSIYVQFRYCEKATKLKKNILLRALTF